MTEPTDAELQALWVSCDHPLLQSFARAVLAKWGTPPAVAGEPVAEVISTNGLEAEFTCEMLHGHVPALGAVVYLSAPQPTQAQAGAVPLTCEWTHNADDSFWDTECGQSWRFDDGGPKENHMNFCHCCGKSLRIKGGQS